MRLSADGGEWNLVGASVASVGWGGSERLEMLHFQPFLLFQPMEEVQAIELIQPMASLLRWGDGRRIDQILKQAPQTHFDFSSFLVI